MQYRRRNRITIADGTSKMISSMLNGHASSSVVTTSISHACADFGDLTGCIHQIMEEYVPLSRQGLSVETGSKHQSLNDVVYGIFVAKEKLNTTILNPVKYRIIYELHWCSTSLVPVLPTVTALSHSVTTSGAVMFCSFVLVEWIWSLVWDGS